MNDDFDYVDRKHGFCWKHKAKPMWIVHYYADTDASFYEAYQIKPYLAGKLKNGREPWTLDNERLSDGDGFKSLEEAMQAVRTA